MTLEYIALLAPPPGELPNASDQKRVEELLAELDAASALESAHASLEVQVRRSCCVRKCGGGRGMAAVLFVLVIVVYNTLNTTTPMF